ncbi:MAG: haloacid dehalogenase, partial [Armatimonadota bacterium]|nr:haloacid dehalogenase [Armatimonadota bacterium]
MSVVLAQDLQLVHSVPGRVRVHLPELSPHNQRDLETALRRQPGIQSVRANSDTSNLVIRFASDATDSRSVLAMVRALALSATSSLRNGHKPIREPAPAAPPSVKERTGQTRRARIAVRGLDRDPETARRVVERLERLPGVKAKASALTGRVLVEWSTHQIDVEDLVSEVAHVELPELPGEDRPTHPMDPAPLQQSAVRLTASSLGLSLLAAQRLAGRQEPLLSGPGLSYASGAVGIAQAFPPLRNGLKMLVGQDAAALLLSLPDIFLSSL